MRRISHRVCCTLIAAGAALAYAASSSASIVAHVPSGRVVTLRAEPGGAAVATVADRTEFGSPTTFGVVGRRGNWVAVISSELPNRRAGWIRRSAVSLSEVQVSIRISLSRRALVVRREGHVVERATVGIGAPATPTPLGVFTVTDKLSGGRYGAYYGCCILALSAHQPHLPRGWRGGDRIAIHGTDEPSTIGAAASAGCLHAGERALRYLMRTVPLGTRVVIAP